MPDQVHVLVDLDSRTDAFRLPARSALSAGRDSLGQDLVYLTEDDLVVSRAQVARISTLRAEVRVTGIKEASRQYLIGGTRNDAFLSMLKIALGEPNPGDPLPVPVYPGVPPAKSAANLPDPVVTFDVLVQAQTLVGVVESQLGLILFDDFRALMRLKRLRHDGDPGDWARINGFLQKAATTRDPSFTLKPKDPTDFPTNLRVALNKTADEFAHLYDGLPEVKSIEEVYAAYVKRPDVAQFIQAKLFLSLDDFKAMMQTKVLMDSQWDEINRLVEKGAQHKRSDDNYRLPDDVRASRDVDAKLTAALKAAPNYTVAGGLDGYYQAFLAVEQYFFMPAESFKYIMSVATRSSSLPADDWAWDNVYDIVASAHREKLYARRRDVLKSAASAGIAANDAVKALAAMLVLVLAVDAPGDQAQQGFVDQSLRRLDSFGVTPDDLAYLQAIASKSGPAPDWLRVYTVLEIAQRNRENFPEPVAEKVEWRNLYPAPDARAVLAQSTLQPANVLPRWKTFGRGEQVRAREPVPAATFGWALSSSLLVLGEGNRTIVLTLGLASDPDHFDLNQIRTLLAPPNLAATVASFNPFQVELSTAKGWEPPASVTISWANQDMAGYPAVPHIDTASLRALTFTVVVADSQPALAAPTRAVHGIDASSPVLRLMLRPIWIEQDAAYITRYQVVRNLLLLRAHLRVAVTGLADLTIRNDQTTLDAKKPFEPFGTGPVAGSRFYMGHPELVAKTLDSVSFRITWMGIPSALGTYYANYPTVGALGNASFTARVALSDGNVLKDFAAAARLFDATDAAKPVVMAPTPPADQGNPGAAVHGLCRRHRMESLPVVGAQRSGFSARRLPLAGAAEVARNGGGDRQQEPGDGVAVELSGQSADHPEDQDSSRRLRRIGRAGVRPDRRQHRRRKHLSSTAVRLL